MAAEDPRRTCPTCSSRGTCSRSHKRGLGEDLLAFIIPVVKPYRCRACNWRGYMGVAPVVKDRVINLWINAIGYLAILVALISFIFFILSDRS